jgi:uncharacterized protein (TIGR00369 family)
MVTGSTDVVRDVIVASPYGRLLGVMAEHVETDRVRVRLPYRPDVTTVGDLVHGGAIAGLIDTAATAAVWSGADLTQSQRGTTVGFTVNFLAGARGCDLLATAQVIQRGRTICVCEVQVEGDGKAVARALVTYKIG